jgi:hypothetical protein
MTEKINDGGPAFPMYSEVGNLHSEGMSLRDFFAAAALQGLIALKYGVDESVRDGVAERELAAKTAYRLADAMIKARQS